MVERDHYVSALRVITHLIRPGNKEFRAEYTFEGCPGNDLPSLGGRG
jgi:hypothetical protein